MKTNIFDYHLPEHLIADYPAENRGQSRLLVLSRKNELLSDHMFADIIHYIQADDLVVFNNSRVMTARLFGNKDTGGKVEILIEKIIDRRNFICHIRANRMPKLGSIIKIGKVAVKFLGENNGFYHIKLIDTDVWDLMSKYGHIPLPPYIRRQDKEIDFERYQTVYGKSLGSIAAPTAGLHFTKTMLQLIQNKGANLAYVTLHVGSGTFKPVKTDNINNHIMHSELVHVSQKVCNQIIRTKERGGRVIAVGTTSVRSLETASRFGKIKPFYGESDIFLHPGKKFNVIDALITNFHLPKSTLIMLVSAFASIDMIKKSYHYAIENNYRFYSYGDAMFIY